MKLLVDKINTRRICSLIRNSYFRTKNSEYSWEMFPTVCQCILMTTGKNYQVNQKRRFYNNQNLYHNTINDLSTRITPISLQYFQIVSSPIEHSAAATWELQYKMMQIITEKLMFTVTYCEWNTEDTKQPNILPKYLKFKMNVYYCGS